MHIDLDTLTLLAAGDQTAASTAELDHLGHCTRCAAELERFRAVGLTVRELADHATLEIPRPQVWDQIRQQLGFDPELSSPTHSVYERPQLDRVEPPRLAVNTSDDESHRPSPSTSRSRRRNLVTLLVAAALAFVLGVAGTLLVQRLLAPSYTTVATATLVALPDWSGSTGEATLESDSRGQRWLVVRVDPSRPVDGFRQVWLINRDVSAMLQVGLLSGQQERFLLPADVNVAAYPVVDVSDEPATDDGAHSGNSIVRGVLRL